GGGEGEEPAGRLGPQPGQHDRREGADRQAGQDGPVDVGEALGDPGGGHDPSVARASLRSRSEHTDPPIRRSFEGRVVGTADRSATFTWFGHSVWEVRTPGGKTVIFDPWYSNPLSPKRPDQVDACDVLLVSHGHGDHFGDALMVGSRTRPIWPCIHEMSLWLG